MSKALTSDVQDYCVQVYGSDALKQFQRIAKKYNLEFEDVLQMAALIHLEQKKKYDPTIGNLPAFLFSQLIWAIRRSNIGALKFASSLDVDDISGWSLKTQTEQIEGPASVEPDRFQLGKLDNQELQEMFGVADDISGKSYAEIAAEWKKCVRRVRQILAEKMQRAEEINKA